MLGFGATTPSVGFNFADFVNITPSPAQGAFSRTPVLGKGGDGSSSNNGAISRTPLAAREARRRINFDGLMPMSTSGMNASMTVDDDDDDDGDNNNDNDRENGRHGSGNGDENGGGRGGRDVGKRPRGLGMELGGELVS